MFNVEITGGFDGEISEALLAETEKQLTEHARAYNCPSHGRSPRAEVRLDRDTDELEFSGVCCEAAVEALVLSLSDEIESDEDEKAEGAE